MIALDYIILCLHVLLERTQGNLYVDICAYKFVSINTVVVVVLLLSSSSSSQRRRHSLKKILLFRKFLSTGCRPNITVMVDWA